MSPANSRAQASQRMSWAEALEIVDRNPVGKVDPPRQDPRQPVILADDEFERLLEGCDRTKRPFLWLYVLVMGETGLRCDSEALWLRWSAIDMEKGFLTVEGSRKGRRTKSGKARVVPLTLRLRQALRDHAARYRLMHYDGGRTEWVFHHDRKRRHEKAGERIRNLRRSFEKAVERAELPAELNQHDLRHRRVTKWLAEGKPAHLVQKAMGHSDLRTTLGYEHLVAEDLLQLVESDGRPSTKEGTHEGFRGLPAQRGSHRTAVVYHTRVSAAFTAQMIPGLAASLTLEGGEMPPEDFADLVPAGELPALPESPFGRFDVVRGWLPQNE